MQARQAVREREQRRHRAGVCTVQCPMLFPNLALLPHCATSEQTPLTGVTPGLTHCLYRAPRPHTAAWKFLVRWGGRCPHAAAAPPSPSASQRRRRPQLALGRQPRPQSRGPAIYSDGARHYGKVGRAPLLKEQGGRTKASTSEPGGARGGGGRRRCSCRQARAGGAGDSDQERGDETGSGRPKAAGARAPRWQLRSSQWARRGCQRVRHGRERERHWWSWARSSCQKSWPMARGEAPPSAQAMPARGGAASCQGRRPAAPSSAQTRTS
jgi:hypothetical protein